MPRKGAVVLLIIMFVPSLLLLLLPALKHHFVPCLDGAIVCSAPCAETKNLINSARELAELGLTLRPSVC